jgi:hypothetical protein
MGKDRIPYHLHLLTGQLGGNLPGIRQCHDILYVCQDKDMVPDFGIDAFGEVVIAGFLRSFSLTGYWLDGGIFNKSL